MSESFQTVDVILAFARWLREARLSFNYRLFYAQKALHNARIWEIGESGGFNIHHDSIRESYAYKKHVRPASKIRSISLFFEDTLPQHRPSEWTDEFVSYPLGGTEQIGRCSNCFGTGTITVMVYNSSEKKTVPTQQTCPTCSGEKKVLTYTSKDYTWTHFVDAKTVLLENANRRSTRALIEQTIRDKKGIPLQSLKIEEVSALAGVFNPRIADTLKLAQGTEIELDAIVANRGTVLRHEKRLTYVPMSFLNVKLGSRYGQFFATNHQGDHSKVLPPIPWCPWRSSFWFVLLGTIILYIADAKANTISLTYPFLFTYLPLLPISLGIGALAAFIGDTTRKATPLWLLLDDGKGGGWDFSLALSKALARKNRAKIEDPYYTLLLDSEDQTFRARTSFFCTLEELNCKQPSRLELLYPSFPGQRLAPNDVADLGTQAHRISWVSGRKPQDLDEIIAKGLPHFQGSGVAEPEIWIIGEIGRTYDKADFPRTRRLVANNQLKVFNLEADADGTPIIPDAMLTPWIHLK